MLRRFSRSASSVLPGFSARGRFAALAALGMLGTPMLLGQAPNSTSIAISDTALYEIVFRRVYAMDKHRAPEQQRAEVEPLRTQFLPEANFTDEEITNLKFVAADCVYQLYMIQQEALPLLRNAQAPEARARLKKLDQKRKNVIVQSIDELRRRFGEKRFAFFDALIRKSAPRAGALPQGQISPAMEGLPETCWGVTLVADIWYDGGWLQGHAILSVPNHCTSPVDGGEMMGHLEAMMEGAYQINEGWGTLEVFLSSPVHYGICIIRAEAEFWDASGKQYDAGSATDTVVVPLPPPPPPPEPPVITSLSPSIVGIGRKRDVTISGVRFGSSPAVSISNLSFIVKSSSDTTITVEIDATSASEGERSVTVTNYGLVSNSAPLNVVCARPVNFRVDSHACLTGGHLQTWYKWDSSTGDLADLAVCNTREVVRYPNGPNPPSPPFPVTSFKNPTIIQRPLTAGVGSDTQIAPGVPSAFVKPYSDTPYPAFQDYEYLCSCSGNEWTLFPEFRNVSITRRVTNVEGGWQYVITKASDSCSMPLPQ